MGATLHNPVTGNEPPNIKCSVENSAKKDWDCCQLKQFCAKVNELDKIAQEGQLKDIRGTDRYDENRLAGDQAAADFREEWNGNPKKKKDPTKSKFYHECAVKKGKIGDEMQVDHVHEIQRGGHPSQQSNLKWLDTSVNASIQGHVGSLPKSAGYVKADCCPAGKAYCKGKGDRANVMT